MYTSHKTIGIEKSWHVRRQVFPTTSLIEHYCIYRQLFRWRHWELCGLRNWRMYKRWLYPVGSGQLLRLL